MLVWQNNLDLRVGSVDVIWIGTNTRKSNNVSRYPFSSEFSYDVCSLFYLKARQLIELTKLSKQSSIQFFSGETKKKNYFPPPLKRKSRLWMKWKLLAHSCLWFEVKKVEVVELFFPNITSLENKIPAIGLFLNDCFQQLLQGHVTAQHRNTQS